MDYSLRLFSLLFLSVISCFVMPHERKIPDMNSVLGASITSEEILLRFYHLKRLTPSVCLFRRCVQKGLLKIPLVYVAEQEGVTIKGMVFSERRIVSTIKQMCTRQEFDPLFEVWTNLMHYKYLYDDSVVKEFSTLIACILHENALTLWSQGTAATFRLREIKITPSLTLMPLEEVLNVLDMLVEEIPSFFEKYELDSRMSWKNWLKKYWLIAPIAAAALIVRAYLIYTRGNSSENEQ